MTILSPFSKPNRPLISCQGPIWCLECWQERQNSNPRPSGLETGRGNPAVGRRALRVSPRRHIDSDGWAFRRQCSPSLGRRRGRQRRADGWRHDHCCSGQAVRQFHDNYPNLIPMSESKIKKIVDAVEPYEFDRIYGGWWDRNVMSGAKDSVRVSARRYIEHISD